jgi:hypothetical protein
LGSFPFSEEYLSDLCMEPGCRGNGGGAWGRRLGSFFGQELGLVIARYIGMGRSPDGEEGPGMVHQFLGCRRGVTCKLVVVLVVG